MKKWFKAACMLLLASMFLCGCAPAGENSDKDPGGKDEPDPPVEETLLSAEEVYNSLSEEEKNCGSYDLDKYLLPYWGSQVIYNESVLPYRDKNGEIPARELAFPIAKVLEVRSNDLKTVYEEGRDYVITEDGAISFPAETSTVPVSSYESIYSDVSFGSSGFSSISEGKYILTGKAIIQKQIYVSYIRTTPFGADLIPAFAGDSLSRTVNKLENKQPVNIVFYGDSITTGASSTGHNDINIEPYAPIFSELVGEKLSELYGYDGVNTVNCATGGWTANDGKENISRVLSQNPDLVVLAFGMNDGGGQKTSAAKNQFYANYITMMERVWQMYPNCEFLLVTSILPNPDAKDQAGNPALCNHEDFLGVAETICEEYSADKVAVCDVMSIHKKLLERKLFMDMGDNYNHPSDFAARLYAQAIVAKLYENYEG